MHHVPDDPKYVGVWVIAATKTCQARVCKYIKAADAVTAKLEACGAPTSVHEYATLAAAAVTCAKACPHWGKGYMRKWTVRSMMLSCMFRSGVKSLKVDTDCTVTEVLGMNPDQTDALTRVRKLMLIQGKTGQNGQEFLHQSGAGRPELFSMWLCFAADRGFKRAHFERFDKSKWLQAAKKLKSKTGINPHPVALASAPSCTVS